MRQGNAAQWRGLQPAATSRSTTYGVTAAQRCVRRCVCWLNMMLMLHQVLMHVHESCTVLSTHAAAAVDGSRSSIFQGIFHCRPWHGCALILCLATAVCALPPAPLLLGKFLTFVTIVAVSNQLLAFPAHNSPEQPTMSYTSRTCRFHLYVSSDNPSYRGTVCHRACSRHIHAACLCNRPWDKVATPAGMNYIWN